MGKETIIKIKGQLIPTNLGFNKLLSEYEEAISIIEYYSDHKLYENIYSYEGPGIANGILIQNQIAPEILNDRGEKARIFLSKKKE